MAILKKKYFKIYIALSVLLAMNVYNLFYLIKQNSQQKSLESLSVNQNLSATSRDRKPASIPENSLQSYLTQDLSEYKNISLVEVGNALKMIEAKHIDEIENEKVAFETTIQLTCDDIFNSSSKMKKIEITTSHVGLKIKNCFKAKNENSNQVSLFNQTNGYSAQLFKMGAHEVNSDFIQLADGENNLVFEMSLNDGQKKTQIIKIHRIH